MIFLVWDRVDPICSILENDTALAGYFYFLMALRGASEKTAI
jgi:hypothetical protein